MSNNLLQKVQEKMGCQPLQKIDVNTLQVVEDDSTPNENKLSQAVIPTVLIAFYKYSRSDDAVNTMLQNTNESNWCDLIFEDKTNEIIEKIIVYCDCQKNEVITNINEVANATITIIKEEVTSSGGILDVKNLLSNSLNEVLLYLPTSMHIGVLLNQNTLDDVTHKMEGPISSVITSIGSMFSASDSVENKNPLTNK